MTDTKKPTGTETDAASAVLPAPGDTPIDPGREPGGDKAEEDDEPAPPKMVYPTPLTIVAMIIVAILGVIAILWAWRIWPFDTPVVTTENAYVRGQVTVLAPQVNGYVTKVPAKDFELVKAGQVLVEIDQRIYRQHVAQSQGKRDSAAAELANNDQTLATDHATIDGRKADLYASQAESKRAHVDELRVNDLAAKGSVSLRERDQVHAKAQEARADVYKSEAAIRIAEQQLKSDTVARGQKQADLDTAEAELRLTQIDLDNTIIRAPSDGRLSQVSVRLGQYVSAGSQLLYLVPDRIWVIANYKETQTTDMHVGQTALFSVDALGGAKLRGHVEQLSPATGSEFSVIRSDNATGNFTKVVQRIPVRISVDDGQDFARRLRPGLSVIMHVDTSTAPGTRDAR